MKKIDAHAHVFDRIGSMGKAGELRPLGNGNCRWATGEEFRIIPEGKGDKEYLVETFMDVMDENDVEKAILLQGVLYGLQNEYAMECAEKYPDRFKAAVMLDPFCRHAHPVPRALHQRPARPRLQVRGLRGRRPFRLPPRLRG